MPLHGTQPNRRLNIPFLNSIAFFPLKFALLLNKEIMGLEAGKIQSSHLVSDHQAKMSDHVPGTEILIAQEARGSYRDELILIPKPQNDPHDPLVGSISFPG
jgi:hypothetical protein